MASGGKRFRHTAPRRYRCIRGCAVGLPRLPQRNRQLQPRSAHHPRFGQVSTFSIFATFPAPYFKSWVGPFFEQVIGTAFLVGFIFAITDEYNAPVKGNLSPFVVGLSVVAIGLSFGADAGYAINPARDFGPRLLAWIEGWKSVALPGDYGNVNAYLWIPIVGPLVGGVIGALVYNWSSRNVLLARGAKPDPEMVEQGADALDEPVRI